MNAASPRLRPPPSGGKLAIRACLINHRIQPDDIDALFDGVLDLGQALDHH